jgi:hypothetical protein
MAVMTTYSTANSMRCGHLRATWSESSRQVQVHPSPATSSQKLSKPIECAGFRIVLNYWNFNSDELTYGILKKKNWSVQNIF